VKKIFLLSCIVLLFSCNGRKETNIPSFSEVELEQCKDIVINNTIKSFGTLLYDKKIDITASQEGVIEYFPWKEGTELKENTVIIKIHNPYIELALERASQSIRRAEIHVEDAQNRLRLGVLEAEGRISNYEKAGMELAQAEKEYEEIVRKNTIKEELFAAGGLSEEEIKVSRHEKASAAEKLAILKKDYEIKSIGLRDIDIQNAGYELPDTANERKKILINLLTKELELALKQAEQAVLNAQLEYKTAKAAFDELTIRSPCKAIIGSRQKEKGERVKSGDVILTIINIDVLYAVSSVSEEDALLLHSGMSVDVCVDSASLTIPGRIDIIAPLADSRTGSFAIKIALTQSKSNVKPGMFVRTIIYTGLVAKRIFVSESSVIKTSDHEGYVFIPGEKTKDGLRVLKKIAVKFSEITNDGILISSGLQSGDLIIKNPQETWKEGQYVVVKK